MGTTYTDAKDDVQPLLTRVLEKYRRDLLDAGVTFKIQFAWNDKAEALKLHGYPCAAIVKIVSYEARSRGECDVVLRIEGEGWDSRNEAERIALLRHEVHHIELVRDKNGTLKTDDCSRPKLKMRLHDIQIGVFSEIAVAHGPASLDYQHIAKLVQRWEQGEFTWG